MCLLFFWTWWNNTFNSSLTKFKPWKKRGGPFPETGKTLLLGWPSASAAETTKSQSTLWSLRRRSQFSLKIEERSVGQLCHWEEVFYRRNACYEYMAYIPGSTFLENNRIEGSGAYKWNICYAIRTVRLPGLAWLSLPCRGRSIPKKGSSYLKGIPKRASSLFRISAILSAKTASSVSGLHVFHSELPPLTRACLHLDRRKDSEVDLSFVFVVARPYLASFPELTSPTTFLYAIRRSQSAL
ncbi:hypothetical protein KY285_016425 [Solanum tuberosum]|nr:hypothetical protein KY284_018578 [Solanum tuberosum]KAH0702147.1 hypothetical protein KY285_016425 [Solanum tuberosum]